MELMARRKMNAEGGIRANDDSLMRFFNRQLETWETARHNFHNLQNVLTKPLTGDNESGASKLSAGHDASAGKAAAPDNGGRKSKSPSMPTPVSRYSSTPTPSYPCISPYRPSRTNRNA